MRAMLLETITESDELKRDQKISFLIQICFWWFSFIKFATQLLKTLLFTSRIWLLLHFISIFSSMCYATWATIPLGDFPSSLSQGKSSIIFLWLLSNRGATNHKMDGLNTLLRLLLLCFQQLEFYGKWFYFNFFFQALAIFLKTGRFSRTHFMLEWQFLSHIFKIN